MIRRLTALTLCTALAACGSSPKQASYSLLGAPSNALEANTGAASRPIISIGPCSLPELQDRPQIVTLNGQHQVHISDSQRWAEPLKTAIPRLMAQSLRQQLPAYWVLPQEQTGSAAVAAKLSLQILRFDAQLGTAATIEALWQIQRPGRPSEQGLVQVVEKPAADTYAALVEAFNRALTKLSLEPAALLNKP